MKIVLIILGIIVLLAIIGGLVEAIKFQIGKMWFFRSRKGE